MKKNFIILAATALLLASCGTYAGSGAVNGAYFGSVLGSAIGGINGGYRGSDIGTIVGMAGGAIVGAAIGDAQDKAVQRDHQQYLEEKARLKANRDARAERRNNVDGYSYQKVDADEIKYDPSGSYDDRIDIDFGEPGDEMTEAPMAKAMPKVANIIVRNSIFVDENNDGALSRGETAEIVFDVFNDGDGFAMDVEPIVQEVTGNKHILVSPSILVESIAPHKGVRYTARVVADRMLKNGMAQFVIKVKEHGEVIDSVVNFDIPTRK